MIESFVCVFPHVICSAFRCHCKGYCICTAECLFKPVESFSHTHIYTLYRFEEGLYLVACMPPVVGSSLILGLLHQSWSWQYGAFLHHVKVTKTKQKQPFIISNWLEELKPSLHWFIGPDSSPLYRLQEIIVMYYSFYSVISLHFISSWFARMGWSFPLSQS